MTCPFAVPFKKKPGVARLVDRTAGVIRAALRPDVNIDDPDVLTVLHLSSAILLVQAVLPAMRA